MRPDLFPYQQEGARFLADRTRAYLADEPGLGKSAQAIRACDMVEAQHILVGCPASLKSNWAREFHKFGLTVRDLRTPRTRTPLCPLPGVTIVNWDIIGYPDVHRRLMSRKWDVLIGDEAHALKTAGTLRTKAVLSTEEASLHQQARRVWLMSGTPAPNHPGELYPILSALLPEQVAGRRYRRWLNDYCYTQDTVYGLRVLGNKPGIRDLKGALADFLLRRKVDQVLPDLPSILSDVWLLDGDTARRQVERVHADHEHLDSLLALADSDYLDEDALDRLEDSELSSLRRLCGEAKAPIVAKRIADELDHGLDCVVLMCWHHSTMDILQEQLKGYGVARVDGKTRDADAEVQRFQLPSSPTDCRVFIGQVLSAGTGHTLTRAHQMVMVEPSWVPGDNEQAMRRIRRIGQNRGCFVRYAALAGTLDEAIMGSAERKARILAQIY